MAEGLKLDGFSGPFQPKAFCDSVILSLNGFSGGKLRCSDLFSEGIWSEGQSPKQNHSLQLQIVTDTLFSLMIQQ